MMYASATLYLLAGTALGATVPSLAANDAQPVTTASASGIPVPNLNTTGVQQMTNASAHGPTLPYNDKNPFDISNVTLSNASHPHNTSTYHATNGTDFLDWRTFKANGVNIGGWLAKEKTHDPIWWASTGAANTSDEWSLCEALGDRCGPVLEERYASFINTSTIDQLGEVGVNVLRITTTYAAWIDVPGSALYHGNQTQYLRSITQYAIEQYGMHIIIGLHSLPGGVNNLDIGEALNHDAWFFNSTNLDYSFQAVDAVLDFIKTSGHINAFTLAPINEASDNMAGFGTPGGLSDNGTNWVNTYMGGVLSKISKVDRRIPLMIQDCFKGASYWSPFYAPSQNIVFDSHVYYFAAAGTYSQYTAPAVCGQAASLASEQKFPVFVGEWALQTMYNNTFAERKTLFDTQRYAWQQYVSGGAFWTAVSYSDTPVDGEGTQRDYWSYLDLVRDGAITKASNESYC